MIHKLNINSRSTRLEIIELQRAGYVIEAALINYYEIPGLLEDESSLLETTEIFYGYSTHEKLVGIISYNIFDTTLDIHRVVVHPDYFNRGIATDMLKHIESHALPSPIDALRRPNGSCLRGNERICWIAM